MMIDKLKKRPPTLDLPDSVVAVGDAKLSSIDLVVFFCDEVDERVVKSLREMFEKRGVRPGIIAMPEDADVAVLDRDAQELLYVYLGKQLGK